MQDSRQVALALDEIAALLTFAGAPRFKARAYEHGARIVEGIADDLGALVERAALGELEGIGPSLSREIEELWNSGESRLLTRLRSEHPPGTSELLQVEGVTPKRVRALHDALGIESVEALREACMAGRVRGLKGFGEKTEARLLASIERWLVRDAGPHLITLPKALELVERIRKALVGSGVAERVELAGAARRGEETLGELALVVQGEREAVFDRLARLALVVRVDRDAGVAHLARGVPLSVHFATHDTLATELLFGTGPHEHVHALVERAAERGLTVEPGGLRGAAGESLSVASEDDVYRALALATVPPELRAASLMHAEGEGFGSLLTAGDVQGMVHCHTTYSDGRNSIEEMARGAEALGMKYITITDHSPSAHYAGGVDVDRLKAQWDEIAAVQERVSIRILRGTESDILADGQLDYPDALLEQFDVIIASIHARHRMDRAAMTTRIARALALPVFKIWGHALGRILLHRDPIDCDVLHLLDALSSSRGAIEINSDPHRLDLPAQWIPAARERGIPFVVSVDAHSVNGLNVLPYGVTQARRGGLRVDEVLNTLGADAFCEKVRPV